jgi:2'-5' RNA ligase
MIRSFVAIDLPESTKERLQQLCDRLKIEVPEETVRWSRIAGLHLTLKFLGNVAEGDVPKIRAALDEVAHHHQPFNFSVEGVGCFPNIKRPRVVWIGVEERSGALAALQRDVERALVPLGFEPERRGFHPHLTLGRTRRNVRYEDQRQLGEVIDAARVSKLDDIRVTAIKLMRSDLKPDGAVYSPLGIFNLRSEPEDT